VDDHWLVEAGRVLAGSVLSWFSKEIFEVEGKNFETLLQKASAIPVGGSGLITLDYFMGNRMPYRNPMLRGAMVGLTVGHDRAALYHSAIEGVALGSANVIKRIKELGIRCNRIVSAGGHVKNPLWLKAAVDAIGQPIELCEHANLTIYDTVASAAVGAGIMKDLFSASRFVAPKTRTLYPDPAAYAIYSDLLLDYLELSDTLALLSRRLAARQLEVR
jgi:ribulose kinase